MDPQSYASVPEKWPEVPETPFAPGHGRFQVNDLYHALPLDPTRKEIRLAHVWQRCPDPREPKYYQLAIGLSVVSLMDDPPPTYKALSYVWNEQVPVEDSVTTDNFLKSSNNQGLYMALKQLSEDGNELVIWVDALCINQKDDEEKASQVAMMATIYQSAEEVIAWLGTESKKITRALSIVEAWANFATSNCDELTKLEASLLDPAEAAVVFSEFVQHVTEKIPQVLMDSKIEGTGPTSLQALGHMTYWTRAWIFQELAFASKARIQNGFKWIPLATLMDAMRVWLLVGRAQHRVPPHAWDSDQAKVRTNELATALGMSEHNLSSLDMYRFLDALQDVRSAQQPASFSSHILPLKLFVTFSGFNSTDPRDKIYALWGFIDQDGAHAALLQPDYSLGAQEVYFRAARYIALTTKSLDVMTYHAHGESHRMRVFRQLGLLIGPPVNLSLPSWVPDWRYEVHAAIFDIRKGPWTSTDPHVIPFADAVELPSDCKIIKAKGIIGGKVQEILGKEIFPCPLTYDASENMLLSSVMRFVKAIMARGPDMVCQYLRFIFAHVAPVILESDARAPLDIMTTIAHNKVDIWGGSGTTPLLLMLLDFVEPVVKVLYSSRLGNGGLWYEMDFPDAPPAVTAMLRLISSGRGAKIPELVMYFPDGFSPIVISTKSLKNDGRGGDFSSNVFREKRRRSDPENELNASARAKKHDSVHGKEEMQELDSDDEEEMLKRALELSLQEDRLSQSVEHVEPLCSSSREGLDVTNFQSLKKGTSVMEPPNSILLNVPEPVEGSTVGLNQDQPLVTPKTKILVEDLNDKEEEEDLRRAIELSLEQEDQVKSPAPSALEEDPETLSHKDEDGDLRRAIKLSLQNEGDQRSLQQMVDSLKDFEWLGQIIDALSAPGDDRRTNVVTAIQATLNVQHAHDVDYARQLELRPDKLPWKWVWHHDSTPPTFFITDHGWIGSCVSCVELLPDDIVCRLVANSMPVLLRPVGSGKQKQRYRMIGSCFIMDPKLRTIDENNVAEMEWFEIV
ncbi:hypothetical protein N0V90_002428 [Kalmusia sp. IMI 367209]|nr:hypothetical protein N0V90_002428 [Kalmusia sp. IMI 367209]